MIDSVPTKPAVQSKTIAAALLGFIPLAVDSIAQILASPILPPKAAAVLGSVSTGLVIIFRLFSKPSKISGILE